MRGTVLGDLYGSTYEGGSSYERSLPELTDYSRFTDDTVCTMAVIEHLMHHQDLKASFKHWVSAYPNAGYGRDFSAWARGIVQEPLNSWGNGALMRIAPVVLTNRSLEQATNLAHAITDSTHAHPISHAAVAQYIQLLWLAKSGAKLPKLLAHWHRVGGRIHDVERHHQAGSPMRTRCDETLEDVMSCLAESCDFNSLLGSCCYHGGDSDTIAAIAGPLGELLWGIPAEQLALLPEYTDLAVMQQLDRLYAEQV